ncbi:MAG: imidazole glycerol phosphate synthase cyclase subunit [Thermaerobacter sp.]|nr:imidazole glycerol phosphate synthase cyclase subunit [Thermaerobacter sp.]
MLRPRIIPCLDVAGNTVVKGTRFEELRNFGDPADLAARYEEQGADEIILLDVTASLEGRTPYPAVVERVARRLGIPLTVGGGLSSADAVGNVLAAGADKVSLNTPALARPELIFEAARRFGSQAIVIAVDVRRVSDDWQVFARGGRQPTTWHLVPWLETVARLGAGEILLTSIDRDGTGGGYDLEALGCASASVRLPIIASGGGASPEHLAAALRVPGVTGALIAGVLHTGRTTVGRIKEELQVMGVSVRGAAL